MSSEPDCTLIQSDESATRAQQASLQEKPEVPGYELVRPLGEGSFGQVWLARQLSTGQSVAVKFCSAPDLSYLRRELERLRDVSDHPGVVSLIDAQLDRRPAYLVMPLLARSLAQELERPGPQQAAEWLRQLASALQHTHDQGLLHCDLKPSNVMLDESGLVRLVDFGQARQQSDAVTAWGTLGYMAPEQAQLGTEGGNSAPSVRWDVYGLGATMYRLLTGCLPYLDEPGLRNLPTGLSERLRDYRAQVLSARLTPIRQLNPRVDRDLADLVEACLDRRSEQRPASMAAILEDLQRRSRGLPLLCRRPWPLAYRASKFLRRPTVLVSLAASLLLLGGATYSYAQLRDANQRQSRSLQELLQQRAARAQAEWKEDEARLVWAQALQNAPEDAFLRTRLAASAAPLLEFQPGSSGYYFELPGRPELLWEESGKLSLCSGGERHALNLDCLSVTPSPDGRRLALGRAHEIEIYDLEHQKSLARWPVAGASQLAWRGESELIALHEGTVRPWTWNGRPLRPFSVKGNPQELQLTEDGEWLLDRERAIRYSTRTGKPVSMPSVFLSPISDVSPDGQWLAAQDARSSETLLVACRGKGTWRPQHNARFLCFSGPSQVVLADGNRVWVENPQGDPPLSEPLLHRSNVVSARASLDGRYLLTATEDDFLHVWDAATGQHLASKPMRWKDSEYGFSGDSSAFYACDGEAARLWQMNPPRPEWTALETEPVQGLGWGPRQERLTVVTESGYATLDAGGHVQSREQTSERVCSWAVSAEGQVLMQFPTALVLYPDAARPERKELLGTLDNSSYQCLSDQRLAFSAEGQWLAANLPGKVQLWQLEGGKPRLAFERKLPLDAEAVAVSPGGQQLAALSGAELHLWWPARGEEVSLPVDPEKGPPSELRYRGDWLWVRRGSEIWTQRWKDGQRLGQWTIAESFDPDAPAQVTADRALLSLQAGVQALKLPGLEKQGVPVSIPGLLTGFALDPEHRSWAAASNQEVDLMDPAGVAPLQPGLPVTGVRQMLYARRHRLIVAPESGGIQSYALPHSESPSRTLVRLAEYQTGYRLDENFRLVSLTRQEWLDRAP